MWCTWVIILFIRKEWYSNEYSILVELIQSFVIFKRQIYNFSPDKESINVLNVYVKNFSNSKFLKL